MSLHGDLKATTDAKGSTEKSKGDALCVLMESLRTLVSQNRSMEALAKLVEFDKESRRYRPERRGALLAARLIIEKQLSLPSFSETEKAFKQDCPWSGRFIIDSTPSVMLETLTVMLNQSLDPDSKKNRSIALKALSDKECSLAEIEYFDGMLDEIVPKILQKMPFSIADLVPERLNALLRKGIKDAELYLIFLEFNHDAKKAFQQLEALAQSSPLAETIRVCILLAHENDFTREKLLHIMGLSLELIKRNTIHSKLFYLALRRMLHEPSSLGATAPTSLALLLSRDKALVSAYNTPEAKAETLRLIEEVTQYCDIPDPEFLADMKKLKASLEQPRDEKALTTKGASAGALAHQSAREDLMPHPSTQLKPNTAPVFDAKISDVKAFTEILKANPSNLKALMGLVTTLVLQDQPIDALAQLILFIKTQSLHLMPEKRGILLAARWVLEKELNLPAAAETEKEFKRDCVWSDDFIIDSPAKIMLQALALGDDLSEAKMHADTLKKLADAGCSFAELGYLNPLVHDLMTSIMKKVVVKVDNNLLSRLKALADKGIGAAKLNLILLDFNNGKKPFMDLVELAKKYPPARITYPCMMTIFDELNREKVVYILDLAAKAANENSMNAKLAYIGLRLVCEEKPPNSPASLLPFLDDKAVVDPYRTPEAKAETRRLIMEISEYHDAPADFLELVKSLKAASLPADAKARKALHRISDDWMRDDEVATNAACAASSVRLFATSHQAPVTDEKLSEAEKRLIDPNAKKITINQENIVFLRNNPVIFLKVMRYRAYQDYTMDAKSEALLRANAECVAKVNPEKKWQHLAEGCLLGRGEAFLNLLIKNKLFDVLFPPLSLESAERRGQAHAWLLGRASHLDKMLHEGQDGQKRELFPLQHGIIHSMMIAKEMQGRSYDEKEVTTIRKAYQVPAIPFAEKAKVERQMALKFEFYAALEHANESELRVKHGATP